MYLSVKYGDFGYLYQFLVGYRVPVIDPLSNVHIFSCKHGLRSFDFVGKNPGGYWYPTIFQSEPTDEVKWILLEDQQ